MRLAFRFLGFVILAIGICISASSVSANSYTLKCNSSKDSVWVYDSLASFAVEAKLNCGEAVEVLERVQDYVKIRARNGIEGYVPESAFSELPAVAHNAQPAPSVAVVAKRRGKSARSSARINALLFAPPPQAKTSVAAPQCTVTASAMVSTVNAMSVRCTSTGRTGAGICARRFSTHARWKRSRPVLFGGARAK